MNALGTRSAASIEQTNLFLLYIRSNAFPLLLILLGAILFLISLGIVPLAEFPEETISIEVHPSNVEVYALYSFRNPWPFPITQSFGFPFPIDAHHPAPFPIRLTLAETGEPINVGKFMNEETFTLCFKPFERIDVQLYYNQATYKPDARYILTTTSAWRRPLKNAHYFLKTNGVKRVQSNYEMKNAGRNVWNWERVDFMPKNDWLIKWERPS